MQFSATFNGDAIVPSWSCTGGTIDSSGLFTADDVEGVYEVTASYNDDEGVSSVEVGTDFDPLTVHPGIEVYIPADEGFLANAEISSLTDQAGNGEGMSTAARTGIPDGPVTIAATSAPIYRANVLNGEGVLETTGEIGNYIQSNGYIPDGTPKTYIALIKGESPAGRAGVSLSISSGAARFTPTLWGYWIFYELNGAGTILGEKLFTDQGTDWAFFVVRVNSAGSAQMRRNMGEWLDYTPSGSWTNDDVCRIGQHGDSHPDPALTQCALLIRVPDDFTDALIDRIIRKYNTRFGAI